MAESISGLFFENVDEKEKLKNDNNAQIDVKMYQNRDVKIKATLIQKLTPSAYLILQSTRHKYVDDPYNTRFKKG